MFKDQISFEVLGFALTTITATTGMDGLELDIQTKDREIPYIFHSTCVRDEGLSLITGKKEIVGNGWKRVCLCTPILIQKEIE